jgi:D-3-phosphoglycerate dehydrogenase
MSPKAVHTFFIPGGSIVTHDELLTKLGVEVNKTFCMTEDQLIAACADADAVLALGAKVIPGYELTNKVIESLPNCKVIACLGIGYDTVDVKTATEHGICVTNVPDYCLEEMSDQALALILYCARKFYSVIPAVKEGKWTTNPETLNSLKPVHRLSEQTLGLIGFGNIPRTLVGKVRSLGFRILVHDPYVPDTVFKIFRVQSVSLDELLRESDFVSLHAALTPENHHMISTKELKRMKNTAHLINTARGGLVDEEALIKALNEGVIAGAGLDVLEGEPPSPDNPLFNVPNCVVTGHFGNYSEESHVEMWLRPWEEAARIFQNKWPQGLVNPQVKDRFIEKWGITPT